jgi:hypothetical protein
MDDVRNTDNAWLETRASHFHDEQGVFTRLQLMDCADNSMCLFITIFTHCMCIFIAIVHLLALFSPRSHTRRCVDRRTRWPAAFRGALSSSAPRGDGPEGILVISMGQEPAHPDGMLCMVWSGLVWSGMLLLCGFLKSIWCALCSVCGIFRNYFVLIQFSLFILEFFIKFMLVYHFCRLLGASKLSVAIFIDYN